MAVSVTWHATVQVQKREEAAESAHADLARKVAELAQKDRSTTEKEKSLSALTADLWAKVCYSCIFLPVCKYILVVRCLSNTATLCLLIVQQRQGGRCCILVKHLLIAICYVTNFVGVERLCTDLGVTQCSVMYHMLTRELRIIHAGQEAEVVQSSMRIIADIACFCIHVCEVQSWPEQCQAEKEALIL